MERPHRQLRAGLADRLRGDHAHSLTELHQTTGRQVAAVAALADAAARRAGEHLAVAFLIRNGFPKESCVWGTDLLPSRESRSIGVMSSEVSRSYRYIVRSPDVRGGHARVEGTRVAVHDVVGLLQNGESVESVVIACLPIITKAQVYECLAYDEDHRGEIDLLVAQQMAHEQP